MNLSGRGAIVAGGAGSIGRIVVAALRAGGASVVVLDSDPNPASFDDAGVAYIATDLADEGAVAAAVRASGETLGKIAVLVNAAGAIHSEPLVNLLAPGQKRHQLSSWDRVLRSNLTTTFLVTSHVAEAMVTSRTKGVIVNFSSVAAAGNSGQSAYAAAKAGVEALTSVWSKELGPLGIRVVAVAPGFVDTPSTRAALPDETIKDWKRRTPLRRLATAEEITHAVIFAIENDYLTGRTLSIDGGLTI